MFRVSGDSKIKSCLLSVIALVALASTDSVAEAKDMPQSFQPLAYSIETGALHLAEDVEIDLADDPNYGAVEVQVSELVARAQHLRKAVLKGATPDHLRNDIQKVGVALKQLHASLTEIEVALPLDRTAAEISQMLDQLDRELSSSPQTPAALPPRVPSDSVEDDSVGQRGLPPRSSTQCPRCPSSDSPCQMERPPIPDVFLDDDFLPMLHRSQAPQRNSTPKHTAPSVPQPASRESPKIVIPKDMKGIALLPRNEQSAALAQQVCPVTGELLGSHGKPIAIHVGSRTVYVCCEGCVSEVKSAPDKHLSKLSAPR